MFKVTEYAALRDIILLSLSFTRNIGPSPKVGHQDPGGRWGGEGLKNLAYAKTWSGVKLWSGVVEWSGFLECFFWSEILEWFFGVKIWSVFLESKFGVNFCSNNHT